jgi:uncharacterized protein YyaL (SSP411 family)
MKIQNTDSADLDTSPLTPHRVTIGVERLEQVLSEFLTWLNRSGNLSYDHYDFWSIPYGLWAKRLYYRWGKLAIAPALPLVIADWLVPASRQLICPKRRFPIADAHYLMGLLRLHRLSGESSYLTQARGLADALISSSIPGFSGHAWGYPFDWQTKRGLWKSSTPLMTTSSYVFDAFLDLYGVTGRQDDLAVARSIANFVAGDIKDTPVGDGCAASYTPFDNSQVINASAYRAACMALASEVFNDEGYRRIAQKNVTFILEQQKEDGSWLYAADDIGDAFVDHFHTCFVLKGLYRTYEVLKDDDILQALKRGYRFYRQALFYPDGRPRSFVRDGKVRLHSLELYDYAEAINLALLLRNEMGTEDGADRLAKDLLDHWQTPRGYFITRVSRGSLRNRVPYHRWAQAQTFRSLVFYYSLKKTGSL